jgi:Kef-type K+ transport system membrane component KefB
VYWSLILLVLAGLAGPLLSNGRRPLVPVVVGELLGGIVLGRTGLGMLDPTAGAMPMLTAGEHVDIVSPAFRAGLASAARLLLVVAVVSVPVGVGIAAIVGSAPPSLLWVLLVGSSAAVVMPILDEHGLGGARVATLTAWLFIADGLTVIAMPLTLTGAGMVVEAIAGDLAIVVLAAALLAATIRFETRLGAKELVERSRQRGWALQLRISLLTLLVFAAIAEATGASLLVAGFATGIILARVARSDRLALQLMGVANGLFVPAFFVLLGATLDIRALFSSPAAIGLALLMGLGSVVVHVAAALVSAPGERVAMGLAASAQLGLPAAAAVLGVQAGALTPAFAAAIVAGGVLTVLPATLGADLLARHLGGAASVASTPIPTVEART